MIGDVGTGKSCMRLQLVEKRLPEVYEKTNYIEYAAKTLDIGSKKIKLEIWDYGENAFRDTLKPSDQTPNCIGVILVFSITSRESFKAAQEWLQDQRMRYNPFAKVVLVGNKADESYKRTVP
jgi:Ras-related protein Rab-4B